MCPINILFPKECNSLSFISQNKTYPCVSGFSYPLEEDLELSMSCNTRDQHGRDRYVANYIDSAIAGHWKNVTAVFQELLMRVWKHKDIF
jgi:hypothetical protein